MGDQNVFIMPQQNIIAAKALFDSMKPMMAEDHVATPVLTRIKAMVYPALRRRQSGPFGQSARLKQAAEWPG